MGAYALMGRGRGARVLVKVGTAMFPASMLLSWGRMTLGFPCVLE